MNGLKEKPYKSVCNYPGIIPPTRLHKTLMAVFLFFSFFKIYKCLCFWCGWTKPRSNLKHFVCQMIPVRRGQFEVGTAQKLLLIFWAEAFFCCWNSFTFDRNTLITIGSRAVDLLITARGIFWASTLTSRTVPGRRGERSRMGAIGIQLGLQVAPDLCLGAGK